MPSDRITNPHGGKLIQQHNKDINDEESTHPYLIITSKNHSDNEIEELLAKGNPSIRVRNGFDTDGVKIFTSNLQEGEAKIVGQKILDVLS